MKRRSPLSTFCGRVSSVRPLVVQRRGGFTETRATSSGVISPRNSSRKSFIEGIISRIASLEARPAISIDVYRCVL